MPRPLDTPARSPSETGSHARRRTTTTPPSSRGHRPHDPGHSPGSRHRNQPAQSSPPPRAPSTRDGRPAPNPPATAASTTPAHDHTQRSSGSSQDLLNPTRQTPKPDSLGRKG